MNTSEASGGRATENERVDVMLTGACREGLDAAAVVGSLAILFRKAPEDISAFFPGNAVCVKRSLGRAEGQRYRDAIVRAGAECVLRPVGYPNAQDPAAPLDGRDSQGSLGTSAESLRNPVAEAAGAQADADGDFTESDIDAVTRALAECFAPMQAVYKRLARAEQRNGGIYLAVLVGVPVLGWKFFAWYWVVGFTLCLLYPLSLWLEQQPKALAESLARRLVAALPTSPPARLGPAMVALERWTAELPKGLLKERLVVESQAFRGRYPAASAAMGRRMAALSRASLPASEDELPSRETEGQLQSSETPLPRLADELGLEGDPVADYRALAGLLDESRYGARVMDPKLKDPEHIGVQVGTVYSAGDVVRIALIADALVVGLKITPPNALPASAGFEPREWLGALPLDCVAAVGLRSPVIRVVEAKVIRMKFHVPLPITIGATRDRFTGLQVTVTRKDWPRIQEAWEQLVSRQPSAAPVCPICGSAALEIEDNKGLFGVPKSGLEVTGRCGCCRAVTRFDYLRGRFVR